MKIQHLAQDAEFPWREMNFNSWPGRELLWLWNNPIVSVCLLTDTVLSAACVVRALV